MREKIKIIRHLAVFFLTVMIFTVGIFIGGELEQQRVQNLYTNLQEQDLEFQKIVAEGNYIDYLVSQGESVESYDCDVIKGAYFTSISNLDDSRIKLENYINTAKVREEEYDRLKEHYSNLQVNYWMLANRINGLCEGATAPILYFYGEKKICPSCQDQGVHLDYVKQILKDDVLIFSLDSQRDGVIRLLAQKYDVYGRELPVIVIDEEIYDFMRNQEIFEILCEGGVGDACNR